jgi:hypothetical protein
MLETTSRDAGQSDRPSLRDPRARGAHGQSRHLAGGNCLFSRNRRSYSSRPLWRHHKSGCPRNKAGRSRSPMGNGPIGTPSGRHHLLGQNALWLGQATGAADQEFFFCKNVLPRRPATGPPHSGSQRRGHWLMLHGYGSAAFPRHHSSSRLATIAQRTRMRAATQYRNSLVLWAVRLIPCPSCACCCLKAQRTRMRAATQCRNSLVLWRCA